MINALWRKRGSRKIKNSFVTFFLKYKRTRGLKVAGTEGGGMRKRGFEQKFKSLHVYQRIFTQTKMVFFLSLSLILITRRLRQKTKRRKIGSAINEKFSFA